MLTIRSRTSASVAEMPEARRLGQHRLLVDHLLQHLPIHPELAQHGGAHVAAVRVAELRHLGVVGPREVAHGDGAALDGGDGIAGRTGSLGRRQEVGHVEEHECEHHEAEAPLEPPLVATHPVEHGHTVVLRGADVRPAASARKRADVGTKTHHYTALDVQGYDNGRFVTRRHTRPATA